MLSDTILIKFVPHELQYAYSVLFDHDLTLVYQLGFLDFSAVLDDRSNHGLLIGEIKKNLFYRLQSLCVVGFIAEESEHGQEVPRFISPSLCERTALFDYLNSIFDFNFIRSNLLNFFEFAPLVQNLVIIPACVDRLL